MPRGGISVAAIMTIRPKARIVSSPHMLMVRHPTRGALDPPPHARPRGARAHAEAYRHCAHVRRSRVLCRARYHGKIPQSAYEHAAGGVGALHRRIPVPVPALESLDPAAAHHHGAARSADRTLGAPPRLDAVQFRGAALPPAR